MNTLGEIKDYVRNTHKNRTQTDISSSEGIERQFVACEEFPAMLFYLVEEKSSYNQRMLSVMKVIVDCNGIVM